jgi:hypothetical protein
MFAVLPLPVHYAYKSEKTKNLEAHIASLCMTTVTSLVLIVASKTLRQLGAHSLWGISLVHDTLTHMLELGHVFSSVILSYSLLTCRSKICFCDQTFQSHVIRFPFACRSVYEQQFSVSIGFNSIHGGARLPHNSSASVII